MASNKDLFVLKTRYFYYVFKKEKPKTNKAFYVTRNTPGKFRDVQETPSKIKGVVSRKVMQFHDTQNVQKVEQCSNHLKLLNNIKEIQRKEREAWMDTNGQD